MLESAIVVLEGAIAMLEGAIVMLESAIVVLEGAIASVVEGDRLGDGDGFSWGGRSLLLNY
jgi:hypothetical protein